MINIIDDLDDAVFEGQRVFMRVDFNVPLDGTTITDDARIRAALPTIQYALDKGASLVLASHLGRPKGEPSAALSLEPAAARLSELLGRDVILPDDCIGDGVSKLAADLEPGQVMLLENLRFHAEETKNDQGFAGQLAALADTYVNDAFGTSHRAHASVVGVASRFARNRRAAGFLIKRELDFLGGALETPKRPFVAVLGGAKVSDKLGVIRALLKKADTILVGGAMAYTLMKARGQSVGESLVEEDRLDDARSILGLVSTSRAELMLPVDHGVATSIDAPEAIVVQGDIKDGYAGYDIGPKTVAAFSERIKGAGTVFWNGPMGVFERAPFATGTMSVAAALASSDAISVVGGGDSASAILQAGLLESIAHVSTGGGASLEFVEGQELPAIAALKR